MGSDSLHLNPFDFCLVCFHSTSSLHMLYFCLPQAISEALGHFPILAQEQESSPWY